MTKLKTYNVLVVANKSEWWEIEAEDEDDAMWRHEEGKCVHSEYQETQAIEAEETYNEGVKVSEELVMNQVEEVNLEEN